MAYAGVTRGSTLNYLPRAGIDKGAWLIKEQEAVLSNFFTLFPAV